MGRLYCWPLHIHVSDSTKAWVRCTQTICPLRANSLRRCNIRRVDGDYLVGALPGVHGLSVATGCNGSMLSAAGGVGRIIATQVMQSLDLLPEAAKSTHHWDLSGTLPGHDADHSSVLAALGAARYAPGRFLDENRNRHDDVYDEAFRAKCAARRGAKFQKSQQYA